MKGIMFRDWKIKAIAEHPDIVTVTRRTSGLDDVNFVGLDGAKQPTNPDQYQFMGFDGKVADFNRFAVCYQGINVGVVYHCKPRYQVGETVYIKEAWAAHEFAFCCEDALPNWKHEGYHWHPVIHKLGKENYAWGMSGEPKWRNPRTMPASAARYFLQITDVRAERVQEITEEDAVKEGMTLKAAVVTSNIVSEPSYRDSFAMLWDSINKPPYDWQANPWVWRIEFKLVVAPDFLVGEKRNMEPTPEQVGK